MDLVYEKMRRLDARGPASRGVVVDAQGAMLGPDCVLVRRTAAGYRCVQPAEAAAIQKVLFGAEGGDPDRLFVLSQGIAKALSAGELALAQIYGLRIPIAGLDSGQLRKLTAVAPSLKANFSPDEPRIPAGEPGGGQWTDGSGGGEGSAEPNSAEPRIPAGGRAPAAVAVGTTAAVAATDEAAASIFGALGRVALAGLSDLAAGMAAPTAFLGVLFLPTNSSLVSEGTLPGRPDLSYRYDQDTGVLDIYRQDDAGRQLLASSHIGVDGLFHDATGDVIGRSLGSTVLVDPNALPAPIGRTGAEARTEAESAQDRPQLCPAPTPEDITGRKDRALAYQQQITGLPPGLEVKLNGVRFDGCREADGTMLEAKGPGYANMMAGPDTWRRWFTGVEPIQDQMERHSKAAVGRIVEWHFAEPQIAAYFRKYAEREGLMNIRVIYTPADDHGFRSVQAGCPLAGPSRERSILRCAARAHAGGPRQGAPRIHPLEQAGKLARCCQSTRLGDASRS